ncbi:TonB family protein [Xanthobacter sediminis]
MTFTLAHGLAVSLVLHGAVLLPFVVPFEKEPPKETVVLVLELQGIEAETQNARQFRQQARGAAQQAPQDAAPPEPVAQATEQPVAERKEAARTPPPQAPSPPQPPEEMADAGTRPVPPPAPPVAPSPTPTPSPAPTPLPQQAAEPSPVQDSATPAPSKVGDPGAANVVGAQEEKEARTLAQAQVQASADHLRDYVKGLTKRVQEHLVYPPSGRKAGLRGTARVAFALEANGTIRPGSLKIAESSGQPELDANALKTIEASSPFDPPPRPIAISIAVTYGRGG